MPELESKSVSLAEVLAYLRETRRTGRLRVRVPAQGAGSTPPAAPVSQLFFHEGHLVDARNEREQGDDLVYRLLAVPAASFAFDRLNPDQLPPPDQRNIGRLQQMLILAAIGALPEEAAATAGEPATDLDTHPLPEPPEEPPVRIRSFKRRNMIPLPQGKPLALQGDLAPGDFASLQDRLAEQQVSGYVTWVSEAAEGLLVLFMGQVIDALWAETQPGGTYEDVIAVDRFEEAAGADTLRHARVYALNPDLVWAYSSIAYGSDRAQEQSLAGVDLALLLERLARRQHTGCVKTVAGSEAAYIFMARGVVLGDYQALPESLAETPGRSQALVAQPGSLVDVYTSPAPEELLVLNQARWTAQRVAIELRRAAVETLGPRADPVTSLVDAAGHDPDALRAAAARAKKITKVFSSPEEHQLLTRRFDALISRLP